MPNPIQPLRDAVKARLQALGGWSGLEDTHIMLGLDMVSNYVVQLEVEINRLAGFAICSECLEEFELYQSSLTGQVITKGKPGRKQGVVWQVKPPTQPQRSVSPRRDGVLAPRLRGGI